METVGVVESAGSGAEHLVGRRIVDIPVMAFGGYASYAIVDAATVLELPDWISDTDGAALHFPFHLGWFALRERGRLQPGETLLVHAAAGGTGSGALVLGKALGARVIATAGSDEKVAFCRELGADHAISYRRGDWGDEVMELTYGRGVDVAFDAVGGDVTVQTFRCMGLNGRHLMAGFAEDITLDDGDYLSPRPIAYGNFDVCGVCLVYVTDPLAVRRTLGFNWPARSDGLAAHAKILEMLCTGTIRTVVGANVSGPELPDALQRMEGRLTTGRLVVTTVHTAERQPGAVLRETGSMLDAVGSDPQYDVFADEFSAHARDGFFNAHYDRPACLDLLGEVAGRTVLDVACGPGLYAEELAARGARVIGLDQSPRMVDLSRQRAPSGDFRVHDLADDLDWLPDQSVDLVLFALALEYVDDRTAALRELRRVLRPEGALVLSRPHPTGDWLRNGGNYFDVRVIEEVWSKGWRVRYWLAPLERTCEELHEAGFLIERLLEPRPRAEAAALDRAAFERLHREPTGFLALRAVPDPRR